MSYQELLQKNWNSYKDFLREEEMQEEEEPFLEEIPNQEFKRIKEILEKEIKLVFSSNFTKSSFFSLFTSKMLD